MCFRKSLPPSYAPCQVWGAARDREWATWCPPHPKPLLQRHIESLPTHNPLKRWGKLSQRLGQLVYYLAESVNPYLWGPARKPTHSEDIGLWIAARWPCSPDSTKKRSRVVLNHKALQKHSSGLRTEKLPPSWPLTLHGLWEFVLTLMGAALHLSGFPAVTGQWLSCSWYRVLLCRSDPIPVWPLEIEGLLCPITTHSASKASSCS